MWSGARISEVLALTPNSFDVETGLVTFETLKRRRRGIVRQVPLPPAVLDELDRFFVLHASQADPLSGDRRLWLWSRTTAWRQVKNVMAKARITGGSAMPKGLARPRHSRMIMPSTSGSDTKCSAALVESQWRLSLRAPI